MSGDDTRYMALALSLGARGLGRVWPNPAVGCVIVRDGRIVGRGWTGDGGRPHGEVVALAQAGDLARGAVVYVTLEPCAHHGQTGPCADALIDAGVARVVVAVGDPDPRVDGGGIAMLRDAGIDVEVGVLEAEARRSHAGFMRRVVDGRPFVTLKMAASLDGRIATARGESKWITGAGARRMVHAMRARHDGVMVGGGTARADDPSLDVRDLGVDLQPVRIVVSRGLDLPLGGKLARTASEVPVWICHGVGAEPGLVDVWTSLGARLFACELGADRQVSMVAAMNALAEAGMTRIFCEGGGALAGSLLRNGLVDELVGFSAGLALGGDGRAMLGPLGADRLAGAPRFKVLETRAVGDDVMTRWERA